MIETRDNHPPGPILWTFRVVEQGHVTRYGVSGADYYKQFLPGGIEAPSAHPAKRIDKRQYDLAARRHGADLALRSGE